MEYDFKLSGNVFWNSNGRWLLTSAENYMAKRLDMNEVEDFGSDYNTALANAMNEYGNNICVMSRNASRPKWKLGQDLITSDTILDSVTFDDLIHRLKYSYRKEHINEYLVRREMQDILDRRFKDVEFLLKNNIKEIIALTTDEPIEDAGHDNVIFEE